MSSETHAGAADAGREMRGPRTQAKARPAAKATRKSVALAYLLWLLVGWLGIHRAYLGRVGSGIVLFFILPLSVLLVPVGIGGLGLVVIAIWLLVDAFLIPGMARSYNLALQDRIEREPVSGADPQPVSGAGSQPMSGVPPHPGPDDDGVTRIIPKAIWDGPQGDFLREIGMSPDDASNLVPTQTDYQARFEEMRREQDAFMKDVNSQMPKSVNLIPWAMIPSCIWQGPHAGFLLANDLYPVAPWNMMLLPDDKKGAWVLKLPKYPNEIPAGLEGAANEMIGQIRAGLDKAHQETGAALANGDNSGLESFTQAKETAIWNVQRLAFHLGEKTHGEKAFARHRELFGQTLRWNADF